MPYSGNVGRYGYSTYHQIGAALRKEKEKNRAEEKNQSSKHEIEDAEEIKKQKEAEEKKQEEIKKQKEAEEKKSHEEPRVCRPSFRTIAEAEKTLLKNGIILSSNDRNLTECKKRYKKWLKDNHPDKGGNDELCREVNSAFGLIFKV